MSDEKNDKIIKLLEEILKWNRLQGIQKARETLDGLLRNDNEKLAYEYSDGRTSREVAAMAGMSHATVINYWKKWLKFGIVEEVASQGGTRYKKILSLSDIGIDVPPNKIERVKETRE